MLYQEGMLCKHFKGENLLEKNIYRIVALGVCGKDIDTDTITYSGDGILEDATDLVVYANIFQNDKLFTREYSDISKKLSDDKMNFYNQTYKVQPLTEEEIKIVSSSDFVTKKTNETAKKFQK